MSGVDLNVRQRRASPCLPRAPDIRINRRILPENDPHFIPCRSCGLGR